MWTHLWKTGTRRAPAWAVGMTALAVMVGGARAATDPGPAGEPAGTLDDLVAAAVRDNPGLQALRAEVDAAREREPLARALPDPRVGVMVGVQHVETRVGPQEGRVTVEQMFPGPGKRPARVDEARSDVARAEAQYEAARAALEARVAEAYFDLYRRERAVEITRDSRDLVVYLEQVVRTAYESGSATYADLMRIQLEIGRLENELRSLVDGLAPLRAALNARLHREPDAALPVPVAPEVAAPLLPDGVLRERARANAPAIRVAEANVASVERSVASADLARRPDWSLTLDWIPTGPAMNPDTPGSGDDAWMLGVMMDIPIRSSRYGALAREARARRDRAAREREAELDDVDRQLARILFEIRNAEREVRLYRDTLLPKARQTLDASDVGFRAGTVTVLELVDAQRGLLELELAHEDARGRRETALAELRALVGGDVVDPAVATAGGSR